jgi:hypothetical protein
MDSLEQVIAALEETTRKFVDNLEWASVEEIGAFMNTRGKLIDQLSTFDIIPSECRNHYDAIQRILKYDHPILAKMFGLRDEASQHLTKTSNAKKLKHRYEKDFGSTSYFYENRSH